MPIRGLSTEFCRRDAEIGRAAEKFNFIFQNF